MTVYRTAQGKSLDMAALAAKNEKTRAVGNMNVNARGDTIDSSGNIVIPVTKKVGKAYKNSINSEITNIVKPNLDVEVVEQDIPNVQEIVGEEQLLASELEIEDDEMADEIEAIKASDENFVIKPASEAPEFVKPDPRKSKK